MGGFWDQWLRARYHDMLRGLDESGVWLIHFLVNIRNYAPPRTSNVQYHCKLGLGGRNSNRRGIVLPFLTEKWRFSWIPPFLDLVSIEMRQPHAHPRHLALCFHESTTIDCNIIWPTQARLLSAPLSCPYAPDEALGQYHWNILFSNMYRSRCFVSVRAPLRGRPNPVRRAAAMLALVLASGRRTRQSRECRRIGKKVIPSAFMIGRKLLLGREIVLLKVRAIELCSLDDYDMDWVLIPISPKNDLAPAPGLRYWVPRLAWHGGCY